MRGCSKLGEATVADSKSRSKGAQETRDSYGPFGSHLFLDPFFMGMGGCSPCRASGWWNVPMSQWFQSALKEQAWRSLFWQYKIKVFSLVLIVIQCSTRLGPNCINLYIISNLNSMSWSSGGSRISGGGGEDNLWLWDKTYYLQDSSRKVHQTERNRTEMGTLGTLDPPMWK